jgi:hypothetical protein
MKFAIKAAVQVRTAEGTLIASAHFAAQAELLFASVADVHIGPTITYCKRLDKKKMGRLRV